MPKPLVVIPSYLSQPSDVDLLAACVASLRRTAGDTVDILVVDDGSPASGLVDVFAAKAAAEHEVELVRVAVNAGFARTVNVGLERARAQHREVVLVNADIVVLTDGWLDACRAAGAGIVGALLLSPRGQIAHAGFYFSRVTGTAEHRLAGAPADLPAALEVAACPVSGAFQYIRPEVLAAIGVYDPEFRMGSEDLDFCLRAGDAGFASVCQGRARATHVEAAFRGRPSPKLDAWHTQSYARFRAKWSLAQLSEHIADVPTPGDSPPFAGQLRALFVGTAGPGSLYHRIVLPATALGSDWCTAQSAWQFGPGFVRGRPGEPSPADYDTVVLQMPSTPDWLDAIGQLRRRGTRVFYEVDWNLHEHVDDVPALRGIETLMRACDGVLCATAFLRERYAAFNANVHVCENGLDPRGYALAKPARDTVTIGWAGTTMAIEDIAGSVTAIAELMRARPHVQFASLGQPVADLAANLVGADRCTGLPMVLVEQYPAALAAFDIVFEPPTVSPRRRGRSQLRWLEASALGTPLVADPETYPNAVPARDVDELAHQLLRLVDDAPLRTQIGETARRTVLAEHGMSAAAASWTRALSVP
ncbi:glycosyltransferase [Solirubrobacter ginsenosidimutans]|uniref:Glycosyltransferase n=1 Tax=Solirubrobacter ginsenosidimutans TaxID=490573 RepID=A0A9X3S2R4_9ACTN|nr:glycosyltransferase [Solirubrobacter ginsenosidimutans]MDA0158908.1 glycosyltransferase [Solirubrobacter ginsenosidimutans]